MDELFTGIAEQAGEQLLQSLAEPLSKEPLPSEPLKPSRKPRLRVPRRDVREMSWDCLDERLDPDAQVRLVWAFVLKLDLAPLLDRIKAREHGPGRDGNDPRLLLALWLFASIEGVGSARQLDELCVKHLHYQWLCGGVSMNYHTLSDFRSAHADFLDELFAQSIAGLVQEGLLDVNTVAQDGMRIRASAGGDSFRRQGTLEQHLTDARAHLAKLREELDLNPAQLEARRKAAQLRAAREKTERLEQAVEQVKTLAQSRESRKEGDGPQTRVSSTDPEARRMKMPDGGTRPAYNAQFATDVDTRLVVGVHASSAGNDAAELEPMANSIRKSAGKVPQAMLVDGGFATRANVELAHGEGIVLYAPLKEEAKQLHEGKDPYAPKKRDGAAMKEFRARMGQPKSKAQYACRGSSAEWTNAQARNATCTR